MVLGGTAYKTKKAVETRCQDMMYGRATIDHAFLLDLLRLHTEADSKIGCGVAEFFIRTNAVWGGVGIWLRRIDGTETDWSWTYCLKPLTPRQFALKAMRYAIAPQVMAFKVSAPSMCVVTGEPVTLESSHVDHHPTTFLQLADAWRTGRAIEWDDIRYNDTADGVLVTEMIDARQREDWISFHQERAELRVVKAGVNLSKPRTRDGET